MLNTRSILLKAPGLANAYQLGFFMGTVYGMAGLVLGSAITMAIGRLPGMIMMSWIGAETRDMSTLGWALLVGGAILLGGLVLLYRNRMERALVRLARWIERFFRGSRSTPVE